MTKKINLSRRLPATSIVEVLVAAALIGVVLTALAVNMVYTQRTLESTYLRTKALDAAQSCLNRFQAARDNNEWPFFCDRLTSGNLNNLNTSTATVTYYTGSSAIPICRGYSVSGQNYTYTIRYYKGNVAAATRRAGTSGYAANLNVLKTYCRGGRDAAFYVQVDVQYTDAVGREKHVRLDKRFERGSMDAEYL